MYKNIIEAKNIKLTYTIQNSFSLKKVFTKKELDRKLSKIEALKGVSFELKNGKNLGIIGTNGSGKSTLLKIIAGVKTPTRGKVSIDTDSVVGYLPQHLMTDKTRTVFEETMMAYSSFLD